MTQRGNIIRDILIGLGTLGAVIVVGAVAPGIFGALNKAGFMRSKHNKEKFHERLKYLKRRKLILVKDNLNGTQTVELSEKSKKIFLKYNLDEISIKPMKKWDGRWRFVMFDIPDKSRKASNALREKLKELGFYQLQKSIWIHNCPIKDEIEFICSVFNIREYVKMGEIINFDDEAARSEFGI